MKEEERKEGKLLEREKRRPLRRGRGNSEFRISALGIERFSDADMGLRTGVSELRAPVSV